jgi:PAS domain S-box-containing protein
MRSIPHGPVWRPPLPFDKIPTGPVAEIALQPPYEAAARWRAIVESAVDGIIVIDHRGRIEAFNPAAERLFGYQSAEVVGRNVSTLMPAEDAARHDGYLERYLTTRVRHIIGVGREVTARRKDGSTFPAHLSVGELTIDGETKFTGIVRDLTDRVALEMKLREESGLVRVGELAAVLAHEVKNPLAAVSGAIQVLGGKLTSSEDREIVEDVLHRLDALSAMMTDLLLFARPPKPRLVPVDVAALTESLLSFLRMDPAWREVDCRIEGTPPPVTADAELLKVALQNLLINALQAMGGRGRLSIVLSEAAAGVQIDVVDSGPGIPPEAQSRLFTPFFTTKARGTGLGLPTAKRIAEAHRGEIRVVETGPRGTILRLTLPASPVPSASLD